MQAIPIHPKHTVRSASAITASGTATYVFSSATKSISEISRHSFGDCIYCTAFDNNVLNGASTRISVFPVKALLYPSSPLIFLKCLTALDIFIRFNYNVFERFLSTYGSKNENGKTKQSKSIK